MTVKGCQRQLIVLQTGGSPLFESAYFILKKEVEHRIPCENEMLGEATRLLEENAVARKQRRLRPVHLLVSFAAGLLAGAIAVGLLWLL